MSKPYIPEDICMESGFGTFDQNLQPNRSMQMFVKGKRSIGDVGRRLAGGFFFSPLLKSTDIPPDWYL